MTDDDMATLREDQFLAKSLAFKRAEGPPASGWCLNCGEPLPPGQRWCDSDCQHDWEASRRA